MCIDELKHEDCSNSYLRCRLVARFATPVRALAASHAPLWKRTCGPRFVSQGCHI